MNNIWVRILGAIVLEFLVAGLMVGALAAGGLADVVFENYPISMLMAAVLGAVLSLIIMLYAQRFGGLQLRAFAFTRSAHHAGFVALAWLMTLGLAAAYILFLDRLGAREVQLLPPHWGVIAIGVVGSLGTIHEEVLSRGYIMPMLHRRFRIPAVLLISTLIFTVIHFPTRGVSFLAVVWFLSGLSYGYLYLKSGSLWAVVALHAVHNFAADLFLYSENGVALVDFGARLGPAERLPYELLLTLGVFALTYLWYGRGKALLAPNPDLLRRWEQRAEESMQVSGGYVSG